MATNNQLNVGLSGSSGTGNFAGSTSPTFITPTLGAALATTINKYTLTTPATTATLTIANNKTLTSSNTLLFSGADSSTINFGAGGTAAYNTGFNSFSPTFSFSTPGDLTVSYATQIGNYVKVGNIVIANYNLVCTPTYTTASGAVNIGNFPFTSHGTANGFTAGNFTISSPAWTGVRTNLSSRFGSSVTLIQLEVSGTALAFNSLSVTNLLTGVQVTIIGTVIYFI